MMRKADTAALTHPDGALARERKTAGNAISVAGLFAAARDNDPDALCILEESAGQLALGVLSGINLFDPEALIIGGGVADADADGTWLRILADQIHSHAFSAEGKRLPVGRAALGNDAGFIGAAALGTLLVTG